PRAGSRAGSAAADPREAGTPGAVGGEVLLRDEGAAAARYGRVDGGRGVVAEPELAGRRPVHQHRTGTDEVGYPAARGYRVDGVGGGHAGGGVGVGPVEVDEVAA